MERIKVNEGGIERGADVTIAIRLMRHGERDKEGNLLQHGREMTKQAGMESEEHAEHWDAVKALGSDAGPHGETGMGRSKETAAIFASQIGSDGELLTPRTRDILSYESFLTKPPYDHVSIYNSLLPENFNDLDDVEKSNVAQIAQRKVVEHLWNLETVEAGTYKKEIAGAYAVFILHYAEMAKRLKSGSRVLLPSGTHGGMMEFLLREALVDMDGKDEWSLDDIGGDFNPSEGFTIEMGTDTKGNEKQILLRFDAHSVVGKERPQDEFVLDREKLEKLADFYNELHAENNSLI